MHAALDFSFGDTSPDVLYIMQALTSSRAARWFLKYLGSSPVGSRDCMSLEYISSEPPGLRPVTREQRFPGILVRENWRRIRICNKCNSVFSEKEMAGLVAKHCQREYYASQTNCQFSPSVASLSWSKWIIKIKYAKDWQSCTDLEILKVINDS